MKPDLGKEGETAHLQVSCHFLLQNGPISTAVFHRFVWMIAFKVSLMIKCNLH